MNVTMNMKLKTKLYMMCLTVMLVNGITVQTKFARISGNGAKKIACGRDATRRKYLGTKIDASTTCTGLGWNWGTAPNFDGSSTYFEKKEAVEVYDTPLVLGGTLKLPIVFRDGARIDMHIEFTVGDFPNAYIRLLDILDDTYDVYSGDAETIMVSLQMYPLDNEIIFKTWRFGWANHASVTPYPFDIGPQYKITFKALTDNIEVLFDGVTVDMIPLYVPTLDARTLHFTDSGMLLHKITFVGV